MCCFFLLIFTIYKTLASCLLLATWFYYFIEEPSASESVPDTSASTSTSNIEPNTSSKKPRQQTLAAFVKRPLSLSRQKKINELILNMIIIDLQPFSIVRDRGFSELLKELEPNYITPSRNTFVTSLLEENYSNTAAKLKSLLEEAQYITITTDSWTSLSNENYISITAHFITRDWQLISCLLSCFHYSERHTSANLYEQIQNIAREWGIIEKIVVAVTDNAFNITGAVKLSPWAHVPCFAHSLNLIVQEALKEIRNIRAKVKACVEYFHRSSQANAKLLSSQNRIKPDCVPLKLKNDVSTRWNSTFYMFERFLELQEAVTGTIGSLHNPVAMLSAEEWAILREICNVLRPFEEITNEMSSEKSVTLSKKIIMIRGLKSVVEKYKKEAHSNVCKRLADCILASIKKRFGEDGRELDAICARSSFLDPRFKLKAFSLKDAITKVNEELQGEAVELINKRTDGTTEDENISESTHEAKPDDCSIWGNFELSLNTVEQKPDARTIATAEIRMYQEERIIIRKENPLLWWKNRELLYPTLSNLAKKYLCTVATSVPSERVFSKAGQIITERRNRLKSKHVNKLIFLNCNQFLLNYKK